MLKFKKGDNVKSVDPKSDLIEALKNDGWVEVKPKPKKKASKK